MLKKKISNLLIVSGLGRNIGKTELAVQLIGRQNRQSVVYGIKVSVVSPEQTSLITHQMDKAYRIFEETNRNSSKDTSRMLRSGAEKVYYLQANPEGIYAAFNRLLEQIPEHAAIVCESNSLGDFFAPGLHVLLFGPEHDLQQYQDRVDAVDICLLSDRQTGFTGIKRISFIQGEWSVSPVQQAITSRNEK